MNYMFEASTSLEEYLPEDFVEGIPIGIYERSHIKREQIELEREISTQQSLLKALKRKKLSLQRKLLEINEEIVTQSVEFIAEDSFEQFILLREKVERKIDLEEEIQFLSEDIILKAQYVDKLFLKLLIKEIEESMEVTEEKFKNCGMDLTPQDIECSMEALVEVRTQWLNILRS